ncbi:MAG: DUF2480 family protein [Chitinophagaceae bacterium]
MSEILINKVTESVLTTIDLEEYFPKEPIAVFDLQPFLFMGLILKEKDFREALKSYDWCAFEGKTVAITCSADAIIPMWAYMLVATYLQPVAGLIGFGNEKQLQETILVDNIRHINASHFEDKRVVIKGCGDLPIGESAYLEITKLLRPVAKSIMYGEPCSTVPIFKRK